MLLTGCATTGLPAGEREPAPHARVVLAPLDGEPTVRLVPQALVPLLPSADRISRVIEARLGSEATVDVRYCVSPAGKIVDAKLERGSTLDAFDQAVMADIAAWKFAPQPGPDSVRSCETATIVYRPLRS